MPMTKIAITLDEEILKRVDALVSEQKCPSRSKAIQDAVDDKLARLTRSRLAEQCMLLDAAEEQEMAEEFSQSERDLWRSC